MVEKINTNNFDEAVAKGLVVVDFSATWCGPCKMLAPVFHEIADEHADIKFLNVDIDESMELAEKYGVSGVPSILVFQDGELAKRTTGYQPKASLEAFLGL